MAGTSRKCWCSSLLLEACTAIFIVRVLALLIGMRVVHAFSTLPTSSSRISTRLASELANPEAPKHVAIIGGGLAGLATAYNLLKLSPSVDITIFDKAEPGVAGASAVAGGLLHPLSPRGKLVYLGLEGLASTNKLIDVASEYERDVVLRDEIFRVAMDETHVSTLKKISIDYPDFTQWNEASELELGCNKTEVLGALRLHSECKVVHLPTYIRGLWQACESLGSGEKKWKADPDFASQNFDWRERLSPFDAVVLCAGAGLFQDSIVEQDLPVQLVGGQSVELRMDFALKNALICGKYVSPLPEPGRALIGATYEYRDIPLTADEVVAELKSRSESFASGLWDNSVIDKITSGFRVQSKRGPYGRMPIIGKIDVPIHDNSWIFTGLSSRGLLYHGIFGELLTRRILSLTDETSINPDLEWWCKE